MIKFLIRFCFLFYPFISFAQSENLFVPLHSINEFADLCEIDNLGNIYIVNTKGAIKKYTQQGEFQYMYSNTIWGKPYSIDVNSPNKILVFYKEHALLVFLDKSLSAIGSAINLQQTTLLCPEAVCTSIQGGFWVYDRALQTLFKFSNSLKILQQKSIKANIRFETSKMIESKNLIFLHEKNRGIHVFDEFANYTSFVEMQSPDIQFAKNAVLWLKNDSLFKMNLIDGSIATEASPVKRKNQNFRIRHDYYIVQDKDRLEIFKKTKK